MMVLFAKLLINGHSLDANTLQTLFGHMSDTQIQSFLSFPNIFATDTPGTL